MNGKIKKPARVAVPTNDGTDIFHKMLGMAKTFHIYEIGEKGFRLIESRNNPYESTLQHLKTLDVYDLISDCDIIISAGIGKKGRERLQAKGMELVFRMGKIEKVLADFIKERYKSG